MLFQFFIVEPKPVQLDLDLSCTFSDDNDSETHGNEHLSDDSWEDGDFNDPGDRPMNQKTKAKTEQHLRLFYRHLQAQDDRRLIEDIPHEELNDILGNFLSTLRKPNGEDYRPVSLQSFFQSIHRHLTACGYPYNIVKSKQFLPVRKKMRQRMQEITESGNIAAEKPIRSMDEPDFEALYDRKQLGAHSAQAIINTMWIFNTMYFGIKSASQHRKLVWGDIKLVTTEDNLEYLEYNGRVSKFKHRISNKLWSYLDPTRCPVQVYKVFASRRPVGMDDPQAPFYISTHRNNRTPAEVEPDKRLADWFNLAPLGINAIAHLMKSMAKHAGLGPLTNDSPRRLSEKLKIKICKLFGGPIA